MRKKIERTAYHEAGHAVAFYHLHVPISYVTIVPDEDSLGHVKDPLPNFDPDKLDISREAFERHCRDGTSPFPPELNRYFTECNITLKTADWMERKILVSFAGPLAEQRFANRHNWIGSDREDWRSGFDTASNLVEGGEILQKYVDYLWARAKGLLNNNPWLWAAVEAVVKELLIRKKMGSRLTRKIIRKAIDDYKVKRKEVS
jgi:hypothetical protein